mmetsp:Transcript_14360/g.15917  ORF Transcript_14360/g.15917 Transcript_14360/m.15917 type:complete len:125 (-) Transcript_14360:543-917(-)
MVSLRSFCFLAPSKATSILSARCVKFIEVEVSKSRIVFRSNSKDASSCSEEVSSTPQTVGFLQLVEGLSILVEAIANLAQMHATKKCQLRQLSVYAVARKQLMNSTKPRVYVRGDNFNKSDMRN